MPHASNATTNTTNQDVDAKRNSTKGQIASWFVEKNLKTDVVRPCKKSARKRPSPNNNSLSSGSKKWREHERAGCCSLLLPKLAHYLLAPRFMRAWERCKPFLQYHALISLSILESVFLERTLNDLMYFWHLKKLSDDLLKVCLHANSRRTKETKDWGWGADKGDGESG